MTRREQLRNENTAGKITVLGLGNPLMGDDSVGHAVVWHLKAQGLPPGVAAFEYRGGIHRYLPELEGSRVLILVDALCGGYPPGTIYVGTPRQLGLVPSPSPLCHEEGVEELLAALELLESRPRVVIVGVEPKLISYSLELSPEVARRLPAVVRLVDRLCHTSLLPSMDLAVE